MEYFRVAPDVPFDLGDKAEFNQDPSSWVNGVKPFVHIDLVLLELPIPDFTTTDAIYLATPALGRELMALSGVRERSYTLAFDPQMEELGAFEGQQIPDLVCLEVTGEYGQTDFAHVAGVAELLVSERALTVLQRFNLGSAEVQPYAG